MKKDSKAKIAGKYAVSLYMGAEEDKSVAKVQADIDMILSVVSADDSLIKTLSNPLWNIDSKKSALKEISSKLKLSKEMLNCLNLIVENGRIKELSLILREFKSIYYTKHNIVEVEVESVKALSAAQNKKLKANLEKHLKSEVVISYKLNPELLGGLVVKYGSNMIDDSIKGKLSKIESVMKGA